MSDLDAKVAPLSDSHGPGAASSSVTAAAIDHLVVAADVLSIEATAAELALPVPVATAWLRSQGLVYAFEVTEHDGTLIRHERVSWRAVLDAMLGETATKRPSSAWINTAEAAHALGIDRSTLDAMVDRAPRNLVGAPVHVGLGKRRKHWRWNPATLHQWCHAYAMWAATRGRRAGR